MFSFQSKIFQTTAVLVAAVVFVLTVGWGISAGKNSAISEMVVTNAQQVRKGLDYFVQDQNRFPTASEFENLQVMTQYLTVVPPPQLLPSTRCPNSLVYKRLTATSYQLNFCLPTNYSTFHSGWNTIAENIK